MALIKQFGLAGLNENVQFGKGNGRLKFDGSANAFSIRNLGDSAYVNIRVAEPLINRDAATKYYVDSVAQGLKVKEAVRVATNSLTSVDSDISTGTITDDMSNLSYNSGNDTWTLSGGVIDNITLGSSDRVLIKDATGGDAVGNGIFVYNGSGTLTRATDADNSAPAGEAAANSSGDIIVQGQKSDPSFATGMTYTLTANGVSYTYGPTTTNDRNYFSGINGLNIPGLTIGWHNDDGFINAIQLTYEPQVPGDQLVIADTTGWTHLAISHGTYGSSGGANAAGTEFGSGVFVFVLEGRVWKDSGWVVNSPVGTATIGTDPISWVQFSRVTGVYANDGLGQDGNRIFVRTDGTTIYLDDDSIAVKSSATQYQSLISDGAGGTAAWGAINLNSADATQNALRRDRGGFGVDVSAFADQSLYLSNGTITTELPIGNPGEVLTVDVNGDLIYDTVVNVIGVLDPAQGGTGQSTYNQYDLLIGDGSNGLTKLPAGVAGQVLVINSSGSLVWGKVDLTDADALSGTLPESHGGTGQSSYTKGDLLYASSTGADGALANLPIGTQGQVLTVDGNSQPVWANGLSGVSSTRQLALSTSTGTISIGSVIPGNSRVTSVTVSIDTAYDSGVSMIVGDPSNADALATADEIDPQTTGIYKIDLMHYYSASTQLSISISGTATTGSGYIIIDYVAT